MTDEGTNFTDDISVPAGCTLSYVFSLEPLSLAGCTAQFITDFGTYPVTLTVTADGQDSVTQFLVNVAASVMSTILVGVYTWRILVTFADGVTVLPYGHGSILVGAT